MDVTSKKVGKLASKTLRSKRAGKQAKSLAGSALSQVEKKKRTQIAGYVIAGRDGKRPWFLAPVVFRYRDTAREECRFRRGNKWAERCKVITVRVEL